MSAPKIEITEWRDEGPRRTPPSARPARIRSTTWIGVVGTVFLHALILQSLPLGSHARNVKPPEQEGGAGATVDKPAGGIAETLILLNLTTVSTSKSSLTEEIASQAKSLKRLPVTILSTDPLPLIEISTDPMVTESSDAVDSGDPALQAALFGRYTGQLDARIERLWKRPRSPVSPGAVSVALVSQTSSEEESVFRCQVKVVRDATGNVLEVQLLQCNGSPEWRQSLVKAIFYASPLPAPPVSTMFTRSLVMSFTGYEYAPGASADAYEASSTIAAQL